MATQSAVLHIRMDAATKAQGNAALEAMGLTPAEAVRLLYHRIIADQAFPLELKVPNKATRDAMSEAREIVRARSARFADADALIADLDQDSGQ